MIEKYVIMEICSVCAPANQVRGSGIGRVQVLSKSAISQAMRAGFLHSGALSSPQPLPISELSWSELLLAKPRIRER